MEINYKHILSKYSKLVPPLLISFLIGFVGIAMADTLMVGRLGSKFLAAASLSNSICSIFFLFSIGVAVGMTPMFAAAVSKKNYIKSTKVLKHGLILNALIGLILYLILYCFILSLKYFNQPQEVIELAKPYLHIVAISLLPNTVKDILRRYIEGLGKAKVSMFFSIIVFLTNVVLNYILINGKLGVPKMYLNGAGWATLVSRIIELILPLVYVFYTLRKKGLIQDFSIIKYSKIYFIKLIRICIPSGFQLTFEIGFLSILNIMAGWIGIISQAAHAISINIIQTILVFPLSIAVASSIIVGHYIGQNNIQMIRKSGIIGYSLTAIFLIFSSLILILFQDSILSWYRPDKEVEHMVKLIFPAILAFIIVDGANVVGVNLLRGMQDTFIPVVLTSSSQWLFGLPISFILTFQLNWQLKGLWWGASLGFFLSSFLLYLRFFYNTSRLKIN